MNGTMTMTVEQMAKELHISRNTAYKLVKQKDFPSVQIGKRVVINRSKLQVWLDEQSSH